MGVYDRQIAQAARIIKAKGELVTWNVAQAPTIANPAQPWIGAAVVPESKPVSIFFPSKSNDSLFRLITGSNVETSKFKGIMPAVGFTPNLADTVTRSDGTILELDSIDPLAPNGQVILWYLGFKA